MSAAELCHVRAAVPDREGGFRGVTHAPSVRVDAVGALHGARLCRDFEGERGERAGGAVSHGVDKAVRDECRSIGGEHSCCGVGVRRDARPVLHHGAHEMRLDEIAFPREGGIRSRKFHGAHPLLGGAEREGEVFVLRGQRQPEHAALLRGSSRAEIREHFDRDGVDGAFQRLAGSDVAEMVPAEVLGLPSAEVRQLVAYGSGEGDDSRVQRGRVDRERFHRRARLTAHFVARGVVVGDDLSRGVVDEHRLSVHFGRGVDGGVFRLTDERGLRGRVVSGEDGETGVAEFVFRDAEQFTRLSDRLSDIARRGIALLRGLRKDELFRLCFVALRRRETPLAVHHVEDEVPPRDGVFRVVFGGILRGIFEDACKRRRLCHGELFGRASEIDSARFLYAVGARAEVDDGEVHGEDLVLGVVLLYLRGDGDLLQFALQGALRAEVRVFDELLGDGGSPLDGASRADVLDDGAQHPFGVVTFVGIEALVFERDESVCDPPRQRARFDEIVRGVRKFVAVTVEDDGESGRGGEKGGVELRLFNAFSEPQPTAEQRRAAEHGEDGEGDEDACRGFFQNFPTLVPCGEGLNFTLSVFHRDLLLCFRRFLCIII